MYCQESIYVMQRTLIFEQWRFGDSRKELNNAWGNYSKTT